MAEVTGKGPRLFAKVSEILGDPFAPRSFSLIAIHKHEIPHIFSEELLAEVSECEAARRAVHQLDPQVALEHVEAPAHHHRGHPFDQGGRGEAAVIGRVPVLGGDDQVVVATFHQAIGDWNHDVTIGDGQSQPVTLGPMVNAKIFGNAYGQIGDARDAHA